MTGLELAKVRRVQADGSVLFRGPQLRVRLAVLKPGLVLVSAQGEAADPKDGDVEMALMAELDSELERAGSLMLFADLRLSPRMPAGSREKYVAWSRRHQARLRPSHVLVQSGLLEMAMSIISMVVGARLFEIHTRHAPFLALLRKEAPNLATLPSVPG